MSDLLTPQQIRNTLYRDIRKQQPVSFQVHDTNLHVGLWYGVICDGSFCTSATIGSLEQSYYMFKDSYFSIDLSKYQVLSSLALAASLISILTNVVHRRTGNKLRSMWSVAICIICVFLSGILGIVTAAHFANTLRYAARFSANAGIEDTFGVPYSIIFTGLGGLVALITYTIIAYNVAMGRNRKEIINSFPSSNFH